MQEWISTFIGESGEVQYFHLLSNGGLAAFARPYGGWLAEEKQASGMREKELLTQKQQFRFMLSYLLFFLQFPIYPSGNSFRFLGGQLLHCLLSLSLLYLSALVVISLIILFFF